jgi:hypothetical protein
MVSRMSHETPRCLTLPLIRLPRRTRSRAIRGPAHHGNANKDRDTRPRKDVHRLFLRRSMLMVSSRRLMDLETSRTRGASSSADNHVGDVIHARARTGQNAAQYPWYNKRMRDKPSVDEVRDYFRRLEEDEQQMIHKYQIGYPRA